MKRKVKAWACVGTHGHIYACLSSPHPQLIGRMEIFENPTCAEKMAIAPGHAVEVTITYEWKGKSK
jgi:hypothetical protein